MDNMNNFGPHLIFLFVLGTVVGSFLNVVAYRYPRRRSIVSPPSSCPACGKRLQALDLIPLLSYLILRGSCRRCKTKISVRYFIVELITGLVFVAVPLYKGLTAQTASHLLLLTLLITVTLVDIEFHRIPNKFLAAGLFAGIILKLANPEAYRWAAWQDSGLGMLAGGAIMLLIYILGRGGMGAGDVKLLVVIGFFLGLQQTLLALLAGFVIGGLFGLVMLLTRRVTRKQAIPFAPFVALGVTVTIIFGEKILSWYISFY